MKKKIYIIVLVGLQALWSLSGCYDDKGNYDYKDIDEIKVSFPGSVGDDGSVKYAQKLGEELSIHPEITYGNPKKLTYKWERYREETGVEKEILSNSKDLDLTLEHGDDAALPWKVGKYSLCYTVTDTETNQMVQTLVVLNVRSVTPIGLYVLHGDENESDLAVISDENFEEGLATPELKMDYYSSMNGGDKLQGEGKSVCWVFNQYYPSILVLTDQELHSINPTTFHTDLGMEELFSGTDMPTGIKGLLATANREVVLYAENDVFYLYAGYGLDPEEEPYFDAVFYDETEAQEWNLEPGYFFSDGGTLGAELLGGTLAFSQKQNRFQCFSGGFGDLPDDPYSPVFNPNNTEGMSLVGIDFGKTNWFSPYYSGQNQWALLRKEKDNSIVAWRFNEEGYGVENASYDMATTIASNKLNSELLEMNCFQMSPLTEGIGFFSVPGAVYSLDVINGLNSGVTELFEASAGEQITKIKILKNYNRNTPMQEANGIFDARIGLCLYIVTWDGMQGRIHRLFVDEEGNADSRYDVVTWEGFGEIRDLCFRLQ